MEEKFLERQERDLDYEDRLRVVPAAADKNGNDNDNNDSVLIFKKLRYEAFRNKILNGENNNSEKFDMDYLSEPKLKRFFET